VFFMSAYSFSPLRCSSFAMEKRSSSSSSHDARQNYAKLAKLGHASYATASAIEKILKTIDFDGLPIAFSRRAQRRAVKSVCSTDTPYGKLLHDLPMDWTSMQRRQDGDSLTFQNPLAFMYYNCKKSAHYAEIVRRALDGYPCTPSTPWNLILYQDGVDASDGLAKNHHRKSAIFYWSFKEFGMRALAHEQVWGIIANVRVDECKAIDGGIARVFEKVLDDFFGVASNMQVAGATMSIDGSVRGEPRMTRTIHAKAGIVLADIPALKELVECIGHSGMKFCCLCQDCIQTKSDIGELLPTITAKAVHMSCTLLSCFELHTNESIQATVRRVNALHAGLIANDKTVVQNGEDYRLRCQVLGWSWSSANIVLNEKFNIKLADSIMYDWAHCYVHDGLGDNELGQCMKDVPKEIASFEELGEYSYTFTFAKCHPNPKHLFEPAANKNNKKKGSFSCTGSEFLTLAPVIHRYFTEVVAKRAEQCPKFMNHARSMAAVCKVIILLVFLPTSGLSWEQLAIAIHEHIELYKLVYGAETMRPKHHYVLHLPDMLRRFEFLFSTFVHERKHRLAKRYMVPRKNTKSFERGVMEDVTNHQLWELEQTFFCHARRQRNYHRIRC
jgi:hypothetical protein